MYWVLGIIIWIIVLSCLFGVVLLIQIKHRFDELIQISKGTNSRLDTHTKALGLINKALGSVFHAVKRNK